MSHDAARLQRLHSWNDLDVFSSTRSDGMDGEDEWDAIRMSEEDLSMFRFYLGLLLAIVRVFPNGPECRARLRVGVRLRR